jgi:hypothetical protein
MTHPPVDISLPFGSGHANDGHPRLMRAGHGMPRMKMSTSLGMNVVSRIREGRLTALSPEYPRGSHRKPRAIAAPVAKRRLSPAIVDAFSQVASCRPGEVHPTDDGEQSLPMVRATREKSDGVRGRF